MKRLVGALLVSFLGWVILPGGGDEVVSEAPTEKMVVRSTGGGATESAGRAPAQAQVEAVSQGLQKISEMSFVQLRDCWSVGDCGNRSMGGPDSRADSFADLYESRDRIHELAKIARLNGQEPFFDLLEMAQLDIDDHIQDAILEEMIRSKDQVGLEKVEYGVLGILRSSDSLPLWEKGLVFLTTSNQPHPQRDQMLVATVETGSYEIGSLIATRAQDLITPAQVSAWQRLLTRLPSGSERQLQLEAALREFARQARSG